MLRLTFATLYLQTKTSPVFQLDASGNIKASIRVNMSTNLYSSVFLLKAGMCQVVLWSGINTELLQMSKYSALDKKILIFARVILN